jgi:sugar lactone lactonase YvrE
MDTLYLRITALLVGVGAVWGAAADTPCDKNHYILSGGECGTAAVQQAIGKVGAVATDAHGNVYFSAPHAVYRLDSSGVLERLAGGSVPGYSGDGGRAVHAQLNIPYDTYPEIVRDFIDFVPLVAGLAADADGSVFIADAYNNRVRRIDPAGRISTVLDSSAVAWPQGLAVDASGTLYVSSAWGPVLRMTRDGTITTLARGNCGPASKGPGLCVPEQIAVDGSGQVYVPDGLCRVRKVGPAGTVVTVVGNEQPDRHGAYTTCDYAGDGGPALGAALGNMPYAVALDAAGNLYIADTGNNCIRKVDTTGTIDTFAGICGKNGGFDGDGSEGPPRSEEPRVGKECRIGCRYRWSQ